MTKFSGPLDVGFIRISNTLIRWVDDIKNKKKEMSDNREDSSYEAVRRWLNPVDFRAKLLAIVDQSIFIHDRVISRRTAVQEWQNSYGGLLNITGDTGYGKTSYAASVAKKLTRECAQTRNFAGFAFCRGLTPSAILRSLLWQFTQVGQMRPQEIQKVMQAYHRHSGSEMNARLTPDEESVVFRQIYEKLLSDYDQVTLILDAVDKCTSQEHLLRHVSLLVSCLSRAQVKCRILATSQVAIEWPHVETGKLLHEVIPISESEMTDDIAEYVCRSLQDLRPPMMQSSQVVILSKCSEVAGDGWPYAMHKLATEYAHEGRHNVAQKIEESVLEYRTDRFSKDSIPTIECERTLAIALGGQGLYQEAETLQRQLLEKLQSNRELNNKLYETIMNDLALNLTDAERWEEAKEIQLQLVDIWGQGGPETSDKLRTGISNLAITYSRLGELENAEIMLRESLRRDIEAFGDDMDHKVIVVSKINFGQILSQAGKWEEAEELQLSAMEASMRIFGMDNLVTLSCMSNAAWTLQKQGKYEMAKELQLQVVAGRTRLQGPNHPQTLGICGNLAETLGNLHEYKEARHYARRALGYYSAK
ncbi:hypothetical protein N7466_001001 [Penicillium verhagenii]|uniref:uncharacterized protein n=1 Tax=Penicillium verhagenii TaxID=1562060 RepID=UPI00254504E8|nr:uncharacterized protein N7466_001001 [Penicillium verhagenii]KAJ5947986.1 hypothetical protein N7466_001001 [Penicillium verhagenii]